MTGSRLYIKGKLFVAWPNEGDLTILSNNYKGACLLQIVSRLPARIVAKISSKHAEKECIIAADQWGFRQWRSTIDAVFVMRQVMSDTAKVLGTRPVIMGMMEVQKPYPNCSSNAMDSQPR